MMFPGSVTMGAQDRLLPPSLPGRFFAAAIAFHMAGWATLLAAGPDAAGFVGGAGPVLAALHMMTLGVLAMTAMGAAIQLLPVATRRPLGPLWGCRLVFLLFAPGVAVLCSGLAFQWSAAELLGGALVVAGLAGFGAMVAANLRGVTDLPSVTRLGWLALASLVLLALLGMLLVVDFGTGILADHSAIAASHAVLAGYGFMGMLAMGFSTILIPMFVLGPAFPDPLGKRIAAVCAAALACGAGGLALSVPPVAALGAVLGLMAVGLHLHGMRGTIKARMKKRLEPFFRPLWVAWAMLPLSLLAGLAVTLGEAPTLWGILLVFGWLLTFVTAILQRIIPFLASMHTSVACRKAAMPSQLTAALPLNLHLAGHLSALALMIAASALDLPVLWRIAFAAGLAGSIAFAAFAVVAMRRYGLHMARYPAIPPATIQPEA
jgi:hypothetical protein